MNKPFLLLALLWPFTLLGCSPATQPAATVVLLAPTAIATSIVAATATPMMAPTATHTPTVSPSSTPTSSATAAPTVSPSASPIESSTSIPLPATRTPTSPLRIVSAGDAATYYNQTVTVEGRVASTYKSDRVIWLIIGTNQKTDFKVVIFPEDWSKFSQMPDVLFRGKTLRATGKVQEYLNAPEMIVKDSRAIVVVQ